MRSILPFGFIAMVAVLGQPAAMAQTAGGTRLVSGLPVESVTVVNVRPSQETIKSFVEKRAAPTRTLGKMARWTDRICPSVTGLGDKYAKYIVQRIRDIAQAVDAPLNSDAACHPNIDVVFTTAPQAFMDNIRKQQPMLLGDHYNDTEAKRMAKVTHPIQAWYATDIVDFDGARIFQDLTCRDRGVTLEADEGNSSADGTASVTKQQMEMPCAIAVRSSGSRINNGLSSGLLNVLIVAEPAKLFDFEIGSLADYIAMLALSQPASLDSCQLLPSISNMLAAGCTSIPARITDGDLAYLRALYKMPNGTSLVIQRDEIEFQMQKTLVTDKAG